ncbi:MAG: STAS domain-containing protein [Paracoccaceae bacterium]
MNLTEAYAGDAHVVRVEDDRIDAAVAILFKDKMREIAGAKSGRVILDLERVSFVDSSGLGAIVAVMKFLAPNCTLELAALSPTVSKVFHMTRMDRIFTIHASAPLLSAQ